MRRAIPASGVEQWCVAVTAIYPSEAKLLRGASGASTSDLTATATVKPGFPSPEVPPYLARVKIHHNVAAIEQQRTG